MKDTDLIHPEPGSTKGGMNSLPVGPLKTMSMGKCNMRYPKLVYVYIASSRLLELRKPELGW